MNDVRRKSPRTLSLLERVLSVVAEVKPGEGVTALLLTLNVGLVVAAFQFAKPVRAVLLAQLEPEFRSTLGLAGGLGPLALVLGYSAVARRVSRRRLLVSSTLGVACTGILLAISSRGYEAPTWTAIVLVPWVTLLGTVLPIQTWAFAADSCTEAQGRRIFALFGAGAMLGALFGSQASAVVLGLGIGPALLVAVAPLLPSAGLFYFLCGRDVGSARGPTETPAEPEVGHREGAFQMVFRHRYLRWLALFSVLSVFVRANSESILGDQLLPAAGGFDPAADASETNLNTSVLTQLFKYATLIGLGLQLFAVSRIVKFGGMAAALLALPIVTLFEGVAVAAHPSPTVVGLSAVVGTALSGSVAATATHMLWLPTSRPMKYRAQQAVDAVLVGLGSIGAGLLALALEDSGIRGHGILNAAAALVWIVVTRSLLRERQRLPVLPIPRLMSSASAAREKTVP